MNPRWWQKWFKLDRLIPLVTMIGVLSAIALSFVKESRVNFTLFENLVLVLLGLISFDAFIERMGILERILKALERVEPKGPELWAEQDLLNGQSFENFIAGAGEVFIFGGSLAGLFKNEFDVIHHWLDSLEENGRTKIKRRKKVHEANLKILLVDPQLVRKGKITVQSLFRYFGLSEDRARKAYAKDVEDTLRIISVLKNLFPDRIEIRLTKETPSVAALMVDQRKARISINLYQNDLKKRPIFEIHKDQHREWYSTFESLYYKQVWEESRRYDPQNADKPK
jgi:hypothetical protein